jgi:hypothetical protein
MFKPFLLALLLLSTNLFAQQIGKRGTAPKSIYPQNRTAY